MGKNKLQKFEYIDNCPHVFQYPFSVLKEKGFDMKGKWRCNFFKNENPIVLELGCGKGEYSVGLAELYPEKNFIGIDIKGARIWSGAKESLEKGMKNVAFLRTSIELLPYFFEENEISEIWITFPDPQMKKERKRLTGTRFLELYRQVLKPQGIVHLKTDSPFLYTYTHLLVNHNQLPTIVDTNDLYNSDFVSDILEIKTFYEQQWLDRGLTIKYISFPLDHTTELKEPEVEIEFDTYRSFSRGELQCPELCNPKITPKQNN